MNGLMLDDSGMHPPVLLPLVNLHSLDAAHFGEQLGITECLGLHSFTFKFLENSRNTPLQLPSQILVQDLSGLGQTFPRI